MKQKLKDKYLSGNNTYANLFSDLEILKQYQKNEIIKSREMAKAYFENDWFDIKQLLIKEIEREMQKGKIKRRELIDEINNKYFDDKKTFEYIVERFGIKENFPEDYEKLFEKDVWLKSIKTISTYLKFYKEKTASYAMNNFQNVDGSDLIDLDYTLFFPYITYFVTANTKHFLFGVDDSKVKSFQELTTILDGITPKLES